MRWSAKPKYGNKRARVDGISFHSQGEADRYVSLKQMLAAGVISELSLQPRFPFNINGSLVCTYIADFLYKDALGDWIVEDFKGMLTPEYKIKAKLFMALYPAYKYLVSKKSGKGYKYFMGGVVKAKKVKP